MPNYIYRCPKCGKELEFKLPINHEKPLCNICKETMKHVMKPSVIIYKGSGFYSTEYR